MKTYLDCYPCFLRQALEASRMAGASSDQEMLIIHQTLKLLLTIPEGLTPPQIGAKVHRFVREVTEIADPYQKIKEKATFLALDLLPDLRMILEKSENHLDTALRLSIAGNIIDLGPNPDYDLWTVIKRVLSQEFAIDDREELYEKLHESKSILYIGDNAGETVFDRLLIENLSIPVTYAVRGEPVLNDATIEDAKAAGLDQVAEVISTGSSMPGTALTDCSQDFQERFNRADLILAKGQGNYETLSEVSAPIFFLLQIKCPVIGRDIGVPSGSIVIKRGSPA